MTGRVGAMPCGSDPTIAMVLLSEILLGAMGLLGTRGKVLYSLTV